MHLDGYKYWLAYRKGTKSYYRCSRSKSQKCPGKLIMENSKVISSIQHDHDKEARNSAVEKFRRVLTKKANEKPNKSLVDIYLEETLNHSEASILYPFTQAESTMRKARSKIDEHLKRNDTKLTKNEEKVKKNLKSQQNSGFKGQHHQKYFYVENIGSEIQVILMNHSTLKILGNIEEIHIDCGLKGDLKVGSHENFGQQAVNQTQNCANFNHIEENCFQTCQGMPNFPQNSFSTPENDLTTMNSSQNTSLVYENFDCDGKVVMNQNLQNSIPETSLEPVFCNIQTHNSDLDQYFQQNTDRMSIEHVVNIDFDFGKEAMRSYQGINIDDCNKNSENGNFDDLMEKGQHIIDSSTHSCDNTTLNASNVKKIALRHEAVDHLPRNLTQIDDFCNNFEDRSDFFVKDSQFMHTTVDKSVEVSDNAELKIQNQSINIQSSESTKNPQNSSENAPQIQQIVRLLPRRFHILTIIALINGRECPIAFGLLVSIDSNQIHQFLNYIKLKISLNPSVILTSPSNILQETAHNIWPEANLKIMYFYYAQSVMKKLKKNFQEITRNIFEMSSLKMILSMPMIPTNYVIPGWEALRKWMSEKNVNLDSLCDYIYMNWLAENAEKISIFNGLTHSINNHTQVFQSELLNSFDEGQLNVEQLVDKISRQATKNFIKFTKTSESSVKKVQKLQKTVKIATKNWISSPFHLRRPIQFLQQVSHCIDDGMMNFVMNFDGHFCEASKNSEPPPLIFFVKEQNVEKMSAFRKTKLNLTSEPPPLVPIRRQSEK